MPSQKLTSWGRLFHVKQDVIVLPGRLDNIPSCENTLLPYGNGRSYGDSCLNAGGTAIKTRNMDNFISFDPSTGVLACEGGILFSEILRLIVPQGWFLPVTPGTRFVTVGGAIANDVHGKNHHKAGTLGRHINKFELLRSTGERMICSPHENADYFSATIGGLGLTGLITWAEIQLRRIGNPWIDAETIRYENLDEFFALCDESDRDYEYTVAWVDCSGKGKRLGRGLFMRGNHAPATAEYGQYSPKSKTFPFTPPISMVNTLTLKAFNTAYYYKQLDKQTRQLQHYEPFFYPLDGILEWNRMYGRRGFYQYQCVIPMDASREAISDILEEISDKNMGSFLAVLKICGNIPSPGMLSFPIHGVSLALDFPNHGRKTEALFRRLDKIVNYGNGRIYPAKDGRMPASLFRKGYPQWQEFKNYIDPEFSSSFWRRVAEE